MDETKPTPLDLVIYRIFDELCQHDELLRDQFFYQSAILEVLREKIEGFEACYSKHCKAKEAGGSISAYDSHMKEMQKLREELRQIVGLPPDRDS